MPNLSPIYRFIFILIVCILAGSAVQSQENQDEIPNKIQHLQREIDESGRIEEDLNRQLERTVGDDRESLERELAKVRNHIEELEERKRELENQLHESPDEPMPPIPDPNNGPPTFIESIMNALNSPTVLAAIIGAIGVIIAALIGIKKRK